MPPSAYLEIEIDPVLRDAAARALDSSGFSLADILRLTVARIARDKCPLLTPRPF